MSDTYQMGIDLKRIKTEIKSLIVQNVKVSLIGLHREVDGYLYGLLDVVEEAQRKFDSGDEGALEDIQQVINRFKEGW